MQATPMRLLSTIRVAFHNSRPCSALRRPLPRPLYAALASKQRCLRASVWVQFRQLSDSRGPSESKTSKCDPSTASPSSQGPVSPLQPATPTSTPTRIPSTEFDRLPQPSSSSRFSTFMDRLQASLFTASNQINELTGYSSIDALKNRIAELEANVTSARRALRAARSAYTSAVSRRASTARSVNDLLQRKSTWSPSDLEEFTSLYRTEHSLAAEESAAHKTLETAELEAEEAGRELQRSMLMRYHEEQIWSDKIRQMSTWGTWGLMGLNVLLFLGATMILEPWRRARLVRGFEEKVKAAIEGERATGVLPDQLEGGVAAGPVTTADADVVAERHEIEEAIEHVAASEMETESSGQHAGVGSAPPDNYTTTPFPEPVSGLAYYKDAFRELLSERQVVVTQKELTTVALQGAAGGAALMGLLLVLLRPK